MRPNAEVTFSGRASARTPTNQYDSESFTDGTPQVSVPYEIDPVISKLEAILDHLQRHETMMSQVTAGQVNTKRVTDMILRSSNEIAAKLEKLDGWQDHGEGRKRHSQDHTRPSTFEDVPMPITNAPTIIQRASTTNFCHAQESEALNIQFSLGGWGSPATQNSTQTTSDAAHQNSRSSSSLWANLPPLSATTTTNTNTNNNNNHSATNTNTNNNNNNGQAQNSSLNSRGGGDMSASRKLGAFTPQVRHYLQTPASNRVSVFSDSWLYSQLEEPGPNDVGWDSSTGAGTEKRQNTWMLDPHGRARVAHDILSVLVLLGDVLASPVSWAWELSEHGPLAWFFLASWGFWLWDVLIGFCTGVYIDGVLVMRRRTVAYRYLTSWLIPDIAVLVIDGAGYVMVSDSTDRTGTRLLRMTKMGRLVRLSRLFRLVRVPDRLDRMKMHPGLDIAAGMLKSVGLLLVVNHLMACGWFGASKFLPSDTGLSWIETQVGSSQGGIDLYYYEAPALYQYLTAMHWAITQMTPGSMQVFPYNSWERVINILCLLLGMMAFSTLISSISSKMVQLQIQQREKVMKIGNLRRFLRRKGISPQAAMVFVQAAFEALSSRNTKPLTVKDIAVVGVLPSSLQLLLKRELTMKHLTLPLFRCWEKIQPEGLRELCHDAIDFVSMASGDILFRPFTAAESMYYLTDGSISYSFTGDGTQQVIEPGGSLSEAALWASLSHGGQAIADVACEVLSINSERLGRIALLHGLFGSVLCDYGRAYVSRMMEMLLSSADVTDIMVPRAALCNLLPSMTFQSRMLIAAAGLRAAREGKLKRRHSLSLVREEVCQGRCMITIDENGNVIRVVHLETLAIKNDEDCTLYELGSYKPHDTNIDVRLPGKKVLAFETPEAANLRVLEDTLAPVADEVVMTGLFHHEHRALSDRTQMETVYLRTVRHARLRDGAEEALTALPSITLNLLCPGNLQSSWRSLPAGGDRIHFANRSTSGTKRSNMCAATSSNPSGTLECLVLAASDGTICLYAWLDELQEDFLTSDTGLEILRRNTENLIIPNEIISRSLELHQESTENASL